MVRILHSGDTEGTNTLKRKVCACFISSCLGLPLKQVLFAARTTRTFRLSIKQKACLLATAAVFCIWALFFPQRAAFLLDVPSCRHSAPCYRQRQAKCSLPLHVVVPCYYSGKNVFCVNKAAHRCGHKVSTPEPSG